VSVSIRVCARTAEPNSETNISRTKLFSSHLAVPEITWKEVGALSEARRLVSLR
jgi:hypothetical protein